MKTLDGLTNQPTQKTTIVLDDGTRAVLTLNFKPQQQGWFFDLSWGGRVISGQRLVSSPNVLRQYLNQIPFGLTVLCKDYREPNTSETFVDGTTTIYLLQGSDLTDVESQIYGEPEVASLPVVSIGGVDVPVLPVSWGPAGGDLRGSYPNPSVIALHDGLNTRLPFGVIAETMFLKRVDGVIVGAPAGGGSTPTGPAGGDLGGTYPDPTLAVIGSASGPIGDATHVAAVTKDSKGRITGLTSVSIIYPPGSGAVGIRTRADLRAYTGMVDKQFLNEEGYGFEGDGGGGIWFFVSADNYSVDNDGTLVVPGGSYGSPAMAGCWHRVGPGTQGASILTSTLLDIRWFGALPNNSDISAATGRAFQALKDVIGPNQLGCLYAPAGQYTIVNKIVFDCGGLGFTFKGDGPGGTDFLYNMAGADTCMIEVKNATTGTLKDFSISWVGGTDNPSVLWVHDCTYFGIANIHGLNLHSTDLTGGVIRCGGNTSITMSGLIFGGNGSSGTVLFWESGSGLVTGNNFLTATDATFPAVRFASFNSIQFVNNFVQGGGPLRKFAGATITSTGADFTVNATAHGFVAGQYILLRGAVNAGYNVWWKVLTVPNANSLKVASTLNLGADTATLSTLWSCMYYGSAGGVCTESMFDDCLLNTGGTPGPGSVGVWVDGFTNVGAGGLQFNQFDVDYGYCAFFFHGLSFTASGIPGSTVEAISLTGCRPNGGPRDSFGSVRIEGAIEVTIDGYHAFPVLNGAQPGTGMTFSTIVVSDGGQANLTQDIAITGGCLTNKKSSALFSAATIQAIVVSGANVHNVSAWNVGVDATKIVLSLQNSASHANGITVGYGNNGGRFTLIDSTGTHDL